MDRLHGFPSLMKQEGGSKDYRSVGVVAKLQPSTCIMESAVDAFLVTFTAGIFNVFVERSLLFALALQDFEVFACGPR